MCSIVPIFDDFEIFFKIVLDSFTTFFNISPIKLTPLCGLLLFWFLFWAKHTGVGKYQDSKNRFLKIDLYKYMPVLLATLINNWFYFAALFRSILSHPNSSLLLSISTINEWKHLLQLLFCIFFKEKNLYQILFFMISLSAFICRLISNLFFLIQIHHCFFRYPQLMNENIFYNYYFVFF